MNHPILGNVRILLLVLVMSAFGGSTLRGEETGTGPAASSPTNQPSAPNGEPDTVSKAEILKRLQELSEELKETRQELKQLKAERNAGKPAFAEPALHPPAPSAPPSTNAPVFQAGPVPIEAGEEKPEAEQERERLERERAIRSVQRSGVLLPKHKMEVEPDFTYSHFSSNQIDVDGFALLPVLVVGDIQSLRIERDIFQETLNFRYGILDNLQADVSVPYRFEQDRYVRQGTTQQPTRSETRREDEGLGDVQFGLSQQVLHEHGFTPDVILQGQARAPTGKSLFDIGGNKDELPMGTGVWGVRGGVTAIKTIDPAVIIFSGGYTYNFGRDITVGQVVANNTTNTVTTMDKPGGTIDMGVAIAVAMNPSFAINLGVAERYTFATELSGIGTVQGSALNEAEIRFGFAWALTHNTVLNFTATAGLTEDTPDITMTVGIPVKF